MKIKYILTDIEGTTTKLSFVKEVLFPYSQKHLRSYLENHQHQPQVRDCLQEVAQTVEREEGRKVNSLEDFTQTLNAWIKQDRKHPALKALQGLIWQHGYETGQFVAHLYEDVVPAFREWRELGIELGIYSSGSVFAQKLLFGYTEYGDLNPLFSHYFDTGVGAKTQKTSYEEIGRQLQSAVHLKPQEILFLSDVEAELDAAAAAHMKTRQLLRPGTAPGKNHLGVESFAQIVLS